MRVVALPPQDRRRHDVPRRRVSAPTRRPPRLEDDAAVATRDPRRSGVAIAIVDRDPLTRAGITALAARRSDVRVVQELGCVDTALEAFSGTCPQVVFIEAALASENEGAAIRALLRSLPHARIIAFGVGNREEELFHIFNAGGSGYLPRAAIERDMFTAIRQVGGGDRYIPPDVERLLETRQRRRHLTPRETDVLQLLAAARSNATIGAVLGISVGTVKLHVKSILAKLGAEDRAEAVVIALDRGFARVR